MIGNMILHVVTRVKIMTYVQYVERQDKMILYKKLSPYATMPEYSTDGAVGLDLCAAIPENSNMVIHPGKRGRVPLGFMAEIPDHMWVQLAARSGLAVKQGIMVMAGIIDPDYRGEWAVILYNSGDKPFVIHPGDRVAQAVVHFRSPMRFVETEEELTYTERGQGGFGSTGV
jgi:dUTP pyrophosphatase